MGRRKWKLYQESMSRNYLQPLNNNVKSRASEHQERHRDYSGSDSEQTENRVISIKNFAPEGDEKVGARNGLTSLEPEVQDWKPQDKCNFCVDGKLDSEPNSQGVLVRKIIHLLHTSCRKNSRTYRAGNKMKFVLVDQI